MADDKPSSDRLNVVIAELAVAQLHSTVTLASMVSKLDVIFLKLLIPITSQYFPSFSSEESPPPPSFSMLTPPPCSPPMQPSPAPLPAPLPMSTVLPYPTPVQPIPAPLSAPLPIPSPHLPISIMFASPLPFSTTFSTLFFVLAM